MSWDRLGARRLGAVLGAPSGMTHGRCTGTRYNTGGGDPPRKVVNKFTSELVNEFTSEQIAHELVNLFASE